MPAQAAVRDLGAGELLGTDDRHVAWRAADGPAVLDLRTNRQVAPGAVPTGCVATGFGAGTLVLTCPGGDEHPVDVERPQLLDVRTGRLTPMDVPLRLREGSVERVVYDGVGRSWIRASVRGYRVHVRRFISRRTGTMSGRSAYTARTTPDLDAPQLVRGVCRPGAARAFPLDPAFVGDGYGEVRLHGGWAVQSGPLQGAFETDAPLSLWRCRARATQRICAADCGPAALHRGRVIWIERGAVWVRRLAGSRKTRVRTGGVPVSAIAPAGDRLALQLTGARGPRAALARLP